MYAVVFKRDIHAWRERLGDYSVIARDLRTLDAARDARCVSGDLVVHQETLHVVKDPAWLWDWEKVRPEGYAAREIANARGEVFFDQYGYPMGVG